MKFGKRIEELKEIHKDRIMLARCGVFVSHILSILCYLNLYKRTKLLVPRNGIKNKNRNKIENIVNLMYNMDYVT